jgi:hypothetical protein
VLFNLENTDNFDFRGNLIEAVLGENLDATTSASFPRKTETFFVQSYFQVQVVASHIGWAIPPPLQTSLSDIIFVVLQQVFVGQAGSQFLSACSACPFLLSQSSETYCRPGPAVTAHSPSTI